MLGMPRTGDLATRSQFPSPDHVLALGVILGTGLPAAAGYDPSADLIDPGVSAWLMAIYGAVPALLMAIGAFCLRGFPITRERQAAVRAEIDTAVASRTGVER